MQAQLEVKHLRELFALRYQVYCIEKGFLSKDEYPDGEESDPFDAAAVHFAAVDRGGKIVGRVRLVRHTPGIGFPYQEHCRDLFSGGTELPIQNAAEISRLLVSKTYLRRSVSRDADFIDVTAASRLSSRGAERRSRSSCASIVLGLYKAIYQYCLEVGITHWYAAMERSLVRLLARYGVSFIPIGPVADYFGLVIPHCASLASLQDSVIRSSEQLAAWFNDPQPDLRNGIRVIRVAASSPYGVTASLPNRSLIS
jgi:N-acyl amino acid synthase of PEP-CTERM/exosortase system